MPVTPFHLGPAIPVKALAPRVFSLGAFAAVQVAIDVESVTNILLGRFPVHATLHTMGGSLVVAAVMVVPARYGLPLVYGALRRALAASSDLSQWSAAIPTTVSWLTVCSGALIGAVSHVLLDALIHPDVRPFAPWADGNPLYVPGSFLWVHVLCAVVGLLGLWPVLRGARARDGVRPV